MRVIAGEYRGFKLTGHKNMELRPTADRVKEAIFSMVQFDTADSVCLDLFAGTGGLGIEALSRGASRVYFCDKNPTSIEILNNNLDMCRIDNRRAIVIKSDWRIACKQIKEKCNLVFIDAPYEMCVYYSQMLETLALQDVLEDVATIVLERDSRAGGYELPAGFEVISEKRYGSVGVDLLVFEKPETEYD